MQEKYGGSLEMVHLSSLLFISITTRSHVLLLLPSKSHVPTARGKDWHVYIRTEHESSARWFLSNQSFHIILLHHCYSVHQKSRAQATQGADHNTSFGELGMKNPTQSRQKEGLTFVLDFQGNVHPKEQ